MPRTSPAAETDFPAGVLRAKLADRPVVLEPQPDRIEVLMAPGARRVFEVALDELGRGLARQRLGERGVEVLGRRDRIAQELVANEDAAMHRRRLLGRRVRAQEGRVGEEAPPVVGQPLHADELAGCGALIQPVQRRERSIDVREVGREQLLHRALAVAPQHLLEEALRFPSHALRESGVEVGEHRARFGRLLDPLQVEPRREEATDRLARPWIGE